MKSVLIHIKIMKHLLPIESSYPNQKHMRYVFRSWPHQTSFRVTPLLFTYTCTLHHVFEHRVCICMCVYTIYEYIWSNMIVCARQTACFLWHLRIRINHSAQSMGNWIQLDVVGSVSNLYQFIATGVWSSSHSANQTVSWKSQWRVGLGKVLRTKITSAR